MSVPDTVYGAPPTILRDSEREASTSVATVFGELLDDEHALLQDDVSAPHRSALTMIGLQTVNAVSKPGYTRVPQVRVEQESLSLLSAPRRIDGEVVVTFLARTDQLPTPPSSAASRPPATNSLDAVRQRASLVVG